MLSLVLHVLVLPPVLSLVLHVLVLPAAGFLPDHGCTWATQCPGQVRGECLIIALLLLLLLLCVCVL